MKILYLSMLSELGGAERGLLGLMRGLRKLDQSVQLELVVPELGRFSQEAERIGVGVHVVPMPSTFERIGASAFSGQGVGGWVRHGSSLALSAPMIAAYVRRLRRVVAAQKPDVVHSNGIKLNAISPLVVSPPSRLLWHIQDFIGHRVAVRSALRAAPGREKRVVAVSDQVADDIRRCLPRSQVVTVHNGIDVDAFRSAPYEPEALDQSAGFLPADGDVVRVGFVATYARWKGHRVFLEALARLPDDVARRVRAFVVGGPIYRVVGSQLTRDELSSWIEQLGLAERVRLLPFQPDVQRVMRALDVFVHASTQPEPFGNVVVEAMAAHCAVIVAATGGVEEAFTAGVDAVHTAPNDPDALAAEIARLVRDPDERRRLGTRAAEGAGRFSEVAAAGKIAAVYRELARH